MGLNHRAGPVPTSLYRHAAQLCVHQVALAALRPSSIAKATAPASGSSALLFPARLPRLALLGVFPLVFRPPPLLVRPTFSYQATNRDWRSASPPVGDLRPNQVRAMDYLPRLGLGLV